MISKGVVTGVSLDKLTSDFCLACIQGKAHCQAFPKESQTTYTTYGKKVIVDLWGLVQVNLLGRNHYYQHYHDMYTHEDCVDFLKAKSEAFGRYQEYEAWVKVQQGAMIKCLDSDGGGEYISTEFTDHLKKAGMAQYLTMHGSPQSRGHRM